MFPGPIGLMAIHHTVLSCVRNRSFSGETSGNLKLPQRFETLPEPIGLCVDWRDGVGAIGGAVGLGASGGDGGSGRACPGDRADEPTSPVGPSYAPQQPDWTPGASGPCVDGHGRVGATSGAVGLGASGGNGGLGRVRPWDRSDEPISFCDHVAISIFKRLWQGQ